MKRFNLARTGAMIVGAVTLAVAAFFAGQASAYQGHMWAAKDHLVMAIEQLQAATPDKAGHRANAISLANQALGQVNAGIAAGAR